MAWFNYAKYLPYNFPFTPEIDEVYAEYQDAYEQTQLSGVGLEGSRFAGYMKLTDREKEAGGQTNGNADHDTGGHSTSQTIITPSTETNFTTQSFVSTHVKGHFYPEVVDALIDRHPSDQIDIPSYARAHDLDLETARLNIYYYQELGKMCREMLANCNMQYLENEVIERQLAPSTATIGCQATANVNQSTSMPPSPNTSSECKDTSAISLEYNQPTPIVKFAPVYKAK